MPHRLPTFKRYRISDDILILILQQLNPISLYRTCLAFNRVHNLVMQFQHLRYKLELAMAGMQDGPALYSSRSSVLMRLKLLMAYKRDWPRLLWTDEKKIKLPAAAIKVGVSGNFLYATGNQTLDLSELPSCRTGRIPSQTRHMKYNTAPQSDCVAVDLLQSLLVAAHTYAGANGQIGLRLKIRNLWTFDKHPGSVSAHYDCPTQVAQQVDCVSIAICAARMVVSIEFSGGLMKHLLMDWCTLQATWLDDLDVTILSPFYLLGIRRSQGRLALNLYNIMDIGRVALEREYELPPIWAKSALRFAQNTVPGVELSSPSTALFYTDPSSRVLLLEAKQAGPNMHHWLFIQESFFRPTPLADRRSVPWVYWNQFCLIREHQPSLVVGRPRFAGNRLVYLEKEVAHPSRAERARLSIIDFSISEVPPSTPTKLWTLIGKQSTLIPNECYREIPSSVTNGHAVESVYATEDNIALVLEGKGDVKPVHVLTFGVPATPSRP